MIWRHRYLIHKFRFSRLCGRIEAEEGYPMSNRRLFIAAMIGIVLIVALASHNVDTVVRYLGAEFSSRATGSEPAFQSPLP